MPPCEGDNNCYRESEGAEQMAGDTERCEYGDGRETEGKQEALTARSLVHRGGIVVKYKCQYVVF